MGRRLCYVWHVWPRRCFALRDPAAIRPAYYYQDEEVVVVASERPVIQTAFNVPAESVKEIDRGHAFIIKRDGSTSMKQIVPQIERKACSFERIYFSRGNDQDIYKERIFLGKKVCPSILKSIDYDVKNTVFSFIPNTAEVSYYGVLKGVEDYLDQVKAEKDSQLRRKSNPRTDS